LGEVVVTVLSPSAALPLCTSIQQDGAIGPDEASAGGHSCDNNLGIANPPVRAFDSRLNL
jgi:hypothetical protein